MGRSAVIVGALVLPGCHPSGSISLLFEEVGDTAAIEDVLLTSEDDEDISNRNGKATIRGPEEGAYEVVAEADGRPTHRFFMSGETGYWEIYYGLTTHADVERISTALGLEVDPALGIVEVAGIWTDGNWLDGMPGATIDLDVPYGAALIGDPGSEAGWKLGNTLPANEAASMVAFVNVPVGAFNVTLTTPEEAARCGTFPSDSDDATGGRFTAAAGEISAIIYVCTKASDPNARTASPRQGLRVDTEPTVRADGVVQLGGRLDAGAIGQASYALRATPEDAPTRVQLEVGQPDGRALRLDQRLDMASTTVDVGGGPLSYAALPDGTYALDGRVLDSEPALLRALVADARLADLTEPMLLGWIQALSGLAEAAPTRIQVSCEKGFSKDRMVHTPTQLGCLRFGADSLSCQVGQAAQVDRNE